MEPHWTTTGMFWATVVVALITIFAAVVNYMFFRTQMDGNVIVYAKHDTKRSTILTLVIENIGEGVALDVQFTSSRPIPAGAFGWEPLPEDKRKFMTDGPFVRGIPSLEPGGRREMDWGQFVALRSALQDKPITITARYKSGDDVFGRDIVHVTESTIDVLSFEGTIAYDDNWSKKISEDVHKIAQALDPVLRGNRPVKITIENEETERPNKRPEANGG